MKIVSPKSTAVTEVTKMPRVKPLMSFGQNWY